MDEENPQREGGDPRLLFLCHTLPYPPDGGVWIRSYHLLRELTRNFQVTVLCFERTGRPEHDSSEAADRLSAIASTEVFRIPQEHSELRKVLDHLRSLSTGRVFTVFKHRSSEFQERLETILRGRNFDLIHVDSLDLSASLPRLVKQSIPVVCGHHNVESQLLRRRAEAEDSWLRTWYLRHQASLQLWEEQQWCPTVSLNVTVSEEDGETLTRLAPRSRVEVVPNGVDVDYFGPGTDGSSEGRGIVFVGSAGWFPNRDGMRYFCEEILSKVREKAGRVPVTWVGSAPQEIRTRMDVDFDVDMPGYVEDVRPYLQSAACAVVPLRVGGGSRLKILDAWAMGKAIVSTPRGCEGLDARDGENILVCSDPDAFAESVVRLLEDPDRRRSLGANARKTAVEQYSWEKIGDEINALYLSLLESDRTA